MRKAILIGVSLAIMLAWLAMTTGVSRAAHNVGPSDMVLATDQHKKPARFPHKKHQDMFGCKECHHAKTPEGAQSPYVEGMEIKKCATCHNSDMANANLNSFKNAAHERCKNCHKKMNAEAGKAAPTKCDGCHIKE